MTRAMMRGTMTRIMTSHRGHMTLQSGLWGDMMRALTRPYDRGYHGGGYEELHYEGHGMDHDEDESHDG